MKKFLWSAFLIGCALLITSCSSSLRVSYMYPGDEKIWDKIFGAQPLMEFSDQTKGVILPHHLIVADELAKFYGGLAETVQPQTVVVIGPNHYQDGEAMVQTCSSCVFESIDGQAVRDVEFVERMLRVGVAEANDQAFLKEHSIYNHMPFVKHYFPEAQVVPIILKWETSLEETRELAQWLDENLPEDSLVIASVDFSHYIPATAADFHDVSSYATIKNFDFDNVFDLEVDSPPSLATIMELMERRGYRNVKRLQHTNNQDYRTAVLDETTSHQFIAFSQGGVELEKKTTVLVVGNLAEGRGEGLGFEDSYRWDINAGEPNLTVNENLSEIRGAEDRFLVGADFLVFDLPEGECERREQNGMKLSFCKLSGDQEGGLAKERESGAEKIFVLYQFEGDVSDEEAMKVARKFGEADVFVGRGLERVLPVVTENGKVMAPSLGDFIGEVGSPARDGLVLGIVMSEMGAEVVKFPINVVDGKPSLVAN